jgi:hypothetical protein
LDQRIEIAPDPANASLSPRSANVDRRGLHAQEHLLVAPFDQARGLAGETNALTRELLER